MLIGELRQLEQQHGSLEQAARACPERADEIQEAIACLQRQPRMPLPAGVQPKPGAFGPVRTPLSQQGFEAGIERLENAMRSRPEARRKNKDPAALPRDPGAPPTDYPGEPVARAVRLWVNRKSAPKAGTQNAIANTTGLPRTAVRRIVRLVEDECFEWDAKQGLLGINGRFRATPETITLKRLEDARGLKPFA